MRYAIGIDVGVGGAIGVVGEDDNGDLICAVEDMPTVLTGAKTKGRQSISEYGLAAALQAIIIDRGAGPDVVLIEAVNAMPEQGVASSFNFGTSYGIVRGVVAALRLPMRLVRPADWKKAYSLNGKQKDEGRALAMRMFPTAPLVRKKDVDRAEALLLAQYGLTEH